MSDVARTSKQKPLPSVSSRADVKKCIQRFSYAWQTPISDEEIKPASNDLLAAVEWTLAEIDRLVKENKALHAKCREVIQANQDVAGTCRRVMEEANRLQSFEHQFHDVMGALRRTKMEHGLCEPIERKACTHCAGQRKLDEMLAEYKGPRIVLA